MLFCKILWSSKNFTIVNSLKTFTLSKCAKQFRCTISRVAVISLMSNVQNPPNIYNIFGGFNYLPYSPQWSDALQKVLSRIKGFSVSWKWWIDDIDMENSYDNQTSRKLCCRRLQNLFRTKRTMNKDS